jgi:hypothetical protein
MFIQEILMEGLLVTSINLSVQKQIILRITWNMESSTQILYEIVKKIWNTIRDIKKTQW